MSEKHVLDRYHEAVQHERQAREKTQALVDRFVDVAQRLRDWPNVGFYGKRTATGVLVQEQDHAFASIRLDEAPSLESILNAREDWAKAKSALRGAKGAMTVEELQTLAPD